jgi:hypothetical protein
VPERLEKVLALCLVRLPKEYKMNLGQLLGGAGDVARAQRVEQEARNLERMRQQESEERLRASELSRRDVEQLMGQRGELHPFSIENQRLRNQELTELMGQRGELHPFSIENQRLRNQELTELMAQRGELHPFSIEAQELANTQTRQAIEQNKQIFFANIAQAQATLAQTLQGIEQHGKLNPILITEAQTRLDQVRQVIEQNNLTFPAELQKLQTDLANAQLNLQNNIAISPLEIQKLQMEIEQALQTFEVNLGTALTENELSYFRLQEAQRLSDEQRAFTSGAAGIAIPPSMVFSPGQRYDLYNVPPPPAPSDAAAAPSDAAAAPAAPAADAAAAPPPAPPPAPPAVPPGLSPTQQAAYAAAASAPPRAISGVGRTRAFEVTSSAVVQAAEAAWNAYPDKVAGTPMRILQQRQEFIQAYKDAITSGGVPPAAAVPAAGAPAAAGTAAAGAAAGAPAAAAGAPAAAAGAPAAAAGTAAADAAAPPAAGLRQTFTEEDFYLTGGTQAVPVNIQRATADRDQLVNLANVYRQAGMTNQYLSTVAEIYKANEQLTYLEGMQGVQEFTIASDPRRLSSVWSAYAGVPIGIQPRSDGLYNVYVNGRRRSEDGISRDEIIDVARSSFDQAYVEQKSTRAERLAEAQIEANVQIAIEEAKGNQARTTEILKERFNYDITSKEDYVIIKPPFGKPMLFNPSGRDVRIGKITVSAYSVIPIEGIPELEE